jgi:hypothetical protein
LGFGVWVFGLGVLAPTPNPQSPIPNPQSPLNIDFIIVKNFLNKILMMFIQIKFN